MGNFTLSIVLIQLLSLFFVLGPCERQQREEHICWWNFIWQLIGLKVDHIISVYHFVRMLLHICFRFTLLWWIAYGDCCYWCIPSVLGQWKGWSFLCLAHWYWNNLLMDLWCWVLFSLSRCFWDDWSSQLLWWALMNLLDFSVSLVLGSSLLRNCLLREHVSIFWVFISMIQVLRRYCFSLLMKLLNMWLIWKDFYLLQLHSLFLSMVGLSLAGFHE